VESHWRTSMARSSEVPLPLPPSLNIVCSRAVREGRSDNHSSPDRTSPHDLPWL